MPQKCPECGAAWHDGKTCQADFHQMLAWEAENPGLGEVHHLMVLCYHLQHPTLYSPAGLAEARQLLVEFVEHGRTPANIRRRNRTRLDSSRRDWNIKGIPGAHGSYDPPIEWTMTAADVIVGGPDSYCDNVRAWAQSLQAALRNTKEL